MSLKKVNLIQSVGGLSEELRANSHNLG